VPDGYEEAITYNLALRLGVEWGRPVSAEVRELATRGMSVIKTANRPVLEMKCDVGVMSMRFLGGGW
jgi:hypothetical protein